MLNCNEFVFVNRSIVLENLNKGIYVLGQCGSGKSLLLEQVVAKLLEGDDERAIYIYDPKTVEFSPKMFGEGPVIVKSEEEVVKTLETILEKSVDPSYLGVLVFVDEVADACLLVDFMINKREELRQSNVRFVLFSQRDVVFKRLHKGGYDIPLATITVDENGTHTIALEKSGNPKKIKHSRKLSWPTEERC